MVIFGTRLVMPARNRKCSIIGWPEKPTLPVTRKALAMLAPPLKFMPESAWTASTPSSAFRKSKCQ
jgi:hypothetical protein